MKKPTGYVQHAEANRRRFVLLFAGFVFGFELVGLFALTMILAVVDRDHIILTNPAGYALRYALPVAIIAALVFRHIYRGHARAVAEALDVQIASRIDEPRFIGIAEAQCTTLGVRLPRFGVIEAAEPNALSVGEGPNAGLIAVTRGLLDRLDDDELAAVLAHEASHIRNGDTRILAANHALMRTAILFQTHNALRLENWRQLWLPLLLPPVLVLMLAGGAATQLSLRYARWAQRRVRLSRDHIADGEAVRVTHFPEALISALQKIGGRGAFPGSHRVDALLFEGRADREGGSHPAIADRLAAIRSLGQALFDPTRSRRDTRTARRKLGFGRRGMPAAAAAHVPAQPGRFHFAIDADGKPLEEPPTPTAELLWLWATDPAAYRRWTRGLTAWHEWREADQRNWLGVPPAMIVPLAVLAMFLAVFHWPADNNPATFARVFDPARAAGWAEIVFSTRPVCDDWNYDHGRCAEGERPLPQAEVRERTDRFMPLVGLFMFGLIGIVLFSPKTLLWIFGVKKEQ